MMDAFAVFGIPWTYFCDRCGTVINAETAHEIPNGGIFCGECFPTAIKSDRSEERRRVVEYAFSVHDNHNGGGLL